MSITFRKKSATIVLIGDNGGDKEHLLQFLYAACLGKNADEFLSLDNTLPHPNNTASGSSLYTIKCTDGTELNVLDTPELGDTHDEIQADAIKHAIQSLVTIVDAIVLVANQSKTALGAGVDPTFKAIFSIFPRTISKNTYFLSTHPRNEEPDFCLAREFWPPWLLKEQIFGPIENMVDLRGQLRNPTVKARQLFSTRFKRALQGLQELLQQVDQSKMQAWDMKILYRRATKIESSIHHALCLDDGTSADSGDSTPGTEGRKDIQKVVELVEEYLLLSASPDFITHLRLVIALLRTNQNVGRIDSCIGQLEDANKALQALETGEENSYKGFVVC